MRPRVVYASVRDPSAPRGNLGDRFAFHLVDAVAGPGEIRRLGVGQRRLIGPRTLLLVGSILEHVPGPRGCVVLGPGFIAPPRDARNLRGNRILGVRGELSRDAVRRSTGRNPEVVSDPGLLLRRFLPPGAALPGAEGSPGSAESGPRFVVHAVDLEGFTRRLGTIGLERRIDNYGTLVDLVAGLATSGAVVSSSLHGVVFAHALGVAVAPVSISGRVTGGAFKFRDHYSSLGLDVRPIALGEVGTDDAALIDLVRATPQPDPDLLERRVTDLEARLRHVLHDVRS